MREEHTFHLHKYEYDEYGVTLKIDRMEDDKGAVKAYIEVTAHVDKFPGMEGSHITMGQQILSSIQGKKRLVEALHEDLPLPHWKSIVERYVPRPLRSSGEVLLS